MSFDLGDSIMNIIPAIDLIGGNAVRLQRGDYSKITVYDNSPVEVAKRFEMTEQNICT